MNVKFTRGNVLISQNKLTSAMFDRDVILTVCNIIGHFPSFNN